MAGVPVNANGFRLAVTAPQQCQLAWLPSDLSAVTAGQPSFALLETRDAAGNRLVHVRADAACMPTLSVRLGPVMQQRGAAVCSYGRRQDDIIAHSLPCNEHSAVQLQTEQEQV